MTDDEAKKVILARRARFIAAALSATMAGAATEACSPEPCLRIADMGESGGAPNPCLSIGVSGMVNSGGVGGSGGTHLGGSSGAAGSAGTSGEGGRAGEGGESADGGASGDSGNGGEGGGP